MAEDPLVELAVRLQALCLGRGLTVSTAESCTGGLLGHLITEVAGSSGYFPGGLVSYADAVKQGGLGVPAAMIANHGAVSAQVARAMAEGARERFGTDLAVAVTGIAGPGGGSMSKPVGLTYLAAVGPWGATIRRFVWAGDRSENKRSTARAALELLIEEIGRTDEGGLVADAPR